jgi:4-carboxymuconolactone decarboxylase
MRRDKEKRMPRMETLAEAVLTEEQREASREAVAGLRGRIPTPMIAWLRNAELARRAQRLGELLRYQTTLAPRHSELAILVCGRHWTSHVEWKVHKQFALQAGLSASVIEAIAAQREPSFETEIDGIVYEATTSLLSSARLPASLYRRLIEKLGELGAVELVAILGYYSLVALTLNAFELGLPDSVAPELGDPDFGQSSSGQ